MEFYRVRMSLPINAHPKLRVAPWACGYSANGGSARAVEFVSRVTFVCARLTHPTTYSSAISHSGTILLVDRSSSPIVTLANAASVAA